MNQVKEQIPESDVSKAGLITFWLDMCSREAESDGKRSPEERISALALMTEIWLLFTPQVDEKNEQVSIILFMLKKAVREPVKAMRLAISGQMFRLLESFGGSKN